MLIIYKNKIKYLFSGPYQCPDFLNKSYIPSLDGWRAVAILIVVIAHTKLGLGDLTLFRNLFRPILGEFGVRIFFVLSGFLITSLLIKEHLKTGKINLASFFIRRFLRIFPVLYLYIFTVYIVNLTFNLGLSFEYFIAPILYINNFPIFPATWLLGHTWSLGVEEQFYLIWPLLFKYCRNYIQILFIILLAMPFLSILNYLYPKLYLVFLSPFLMYAHYIFFGAAVSILCFKGFLDKGIALKMLKSKFAIFILFITVVILTTLTHKGLFGKVTIPFGDTLNALLISTLILNSIIYKNTILYKLLNAKGMKSLGTISYSLYIWQQLFILPTNSYPQLEKYFYFPFNIVLAIMAAIISYHFFEKPILKFKDKFSLK